MNERLKQEYRAFVEEDPVYKKQVNNIVGEAIARHFYNLALEDVRRVVEELRDNAGTFSQGAYSMADEILNYINNLTK